MSLAARMEEAPVARGKEAARAVAEDAALHADAGSTEHAAALDEDALYRAIVSRDRRFEGRFVVAVTSTRIYCRPGCPARTPLRKNVRFYASPAAAQAAGFRACARCRPDATTWRGTSATVQRALVLIDSGALAEDDVAALAERLGVGDRHLRRLFQQHLGASPLQVALTRRAHFARQLIDQTALPLTEIAFASGFASVRRFNGSMRLAFGRTPSELRRPARSDGTREKKRARSDGTREKKRARSDGARDKKQTRSDGRVRKNENSRERDDGALTLKLALRPPYAWPSLIEFLAARAIPGIEDVTPERYRRTLVSDGKLGTLEVRPARDHLLLTLRVPSARGLREAVERVRHLFDLDADPLAIAAALARDAHLQPAIARLPGLRVPGAWDPFEVAVRAILGQQVSVSRATKLCGALVAAWGTPLPSPEPGLTHAFPAARAIAKIDGEELSRVIGMPRARGRALQAMARAVAGGKVILDGAQPLETLLESLCALPGIGLWTASYLAMRLHQLDAFPAGDLWLRRAFAELDERGLVARAEAWRPFRAYAAMYLWNAASLEAKT